MFFRNMLVISTKISTIFFIHNKINFKNVNSVNKIYLLQQIVIQKYCTKAKLSSEEIKDITISSLNEYKSKHCPAYKYSSLKLKEMFNLSNDEAKDLIDKCLVLKDVSCETLENNYSLCKSVHITDDVLLKYPIILTINDLKMKLFELQKLNVDINLIAPLVTASTNVLRTIVINANIEESKVPYRNRIIYLSKLLNLPPQEICLKVINHTYILRMELDRLDKILKILLNYGIEPKNILNDCWALRYSPQLAEERLQRAINANVHKVKTWMIRCQDKVFERCINRQIENRTILGDHSSVEEYLSKRLECSIENAKYLTDKYPALGKMNILKMKEILDFLYEQGYTPLHVCRVPRIMIHSQETTKQRIEQLKHLDYVPPSLAILCKSKRDFDKILKKYIKRKKQNDSKKK